MVGRAKTKVPKWYHSVCHCTVLHQNTNYWTFQCKRNQPFAGYFVSFVFCRIAILVIYGYLHEVFIDILNFRNKFVDKYALVIEKKHLYVFGIIICGGRIEESGKRVTFDVYVISTKFLCLLNTYHGNFYVCFLYFLSVSECCFLEKNAEFDV